MIRWTSAYPARQEGQAWVNQILDGTLLHRDADIIPELALKDVEMEVKYLGGKNFARGQDPDTGPYRVWTS